MIKLNIASGPNLFLDGWLNADKEDMSQYIGFLMIVNTVTNVMPPEQAKLARRIQAGETLVFRTCDLRQRWAIADNSVSLIYAGQIIEHLNPVWEAPRFIKECYRVLEPGGILRVSTPDLEKILKVYRDGRMNVFSIEQPPVYANVKSDALRFGFLLFGSLGSTCTTEHYEGHMMTYCESSMRELLESCGFQDITFWPPTKSQSEVIMKECQDTGMSHSLYAEAKK